MLKPTLEERDQLANSAEIVAGRILRDIQWLSALLDFIDFQNGVSWLDQAEAKIEATRMELKLFVEAGKKQESIISLDKSRVDHFEGQEDQ